MKNYMIQNEIILSICISTYNRSKLLYKNILNILKYDGNDIEVIVSDNNSSDNTIELINTIKDNRIKIFANETNFGATKGWWIALKHGRGKYLLSCNDRDTLDYRALSRYVRFLKNSQFDMIFLNVIEGHSRMVDLKKEPEFLFENIHPTKVTRSREYVESMGWTTEKIVKAEYKDFLINSVNSIKRAFVANGIYCYNFHAVERLTPSRILENLKPKRISEEPYFTYESRLMLLKRHLEVYKTDEELVLRGMYRCFWKGAIVYYKACLQNISLCKRYNYYNKDIKKINWFLFSLKVCRESIFLYYQSGIKNIKIYFNIINDTLSLIYRYRHLLFHL